MSQPEQYRDGVYLAEEHQASRRREPVAGGPEYTETFRGDGGARPEARMQGEREPILRDGFRDSTVREQARELGREVPARDAVGRAVGSRLPAGNPLPTGTGAGAESHGQRPTPPGRALQGTSSQAPPGEEDPSSMQKAMGLLKQAAPFVARLLPLIDGNFATALGNLFGPRPHTQAQVSVDLTPVQNQITDLQLQQNELRGTVQEQTAGLKRVEDQLELVREATDRNTLEQQELIEDLKSMGQKVSMIAVGLSALLVLSVIMNVVLYLYMRRVLP